MSKKVILHVPVDMKVRDRDIRALALIDVRSQRPGASVTVSLHHLASELKVSQDTMRRALSSCRELGYLKIVQNRLASGGQVENSYTLTDLGLSVLNAARTSGVVK